MKTYYLYDGHLGGIYYTDEYEEPEYCETCGDSDSYIGEFSTLSKLRKLMKNMGYYNDFINEFVEDFKIEEEL